MTTATRAPTVLVAADKFKGTLGGESVCRALAAGLRERGAVVRLCPVADGGDGTLLALAAQDWRLVEIDAAGPTRVPRRARIGLRGDEAFVELAEVCGIALQPQGVLAGLRSSTWGLGLAMRAALDAGIRRLYVGLGGSASTDGGLGMLMALGALVLDRSGERCTPDATGLMRAALLDLRGLDQRLAQVEVVAITDVTNPLTGPAGAACVYGPQKGLRGSAIAELDAALGRWADLLREAGSVGDPDRPGAGAAGGTGAGLVGALGATIRAGAPFVLDAVGFDDHLAGADLVVTGEGSWDEQSGHGKAPGEVLRRAQARGIPSALVAGRLAAPEAAEALGARSLISLSDLAGDTATAMRDPERLLRIAGARIATALPAPTTSSSRPSVEEIR